VDHLGDRVLRKDPPQQPGIADIAFDALWNPPADAPHAFQYRPSAVAEMIQDQKRLTAGRERYAGM
jgi:hypothetical protein